MTDEAEQKSVGDFLELKRKHREQGKMLRELEKHQGADAYEVHKRLVAEAQKKKTLAAQDIYPIPPIRDPIRRAAGCASFVEFCKVYLADQFYLPWSKYHYRAAQKIERAARRGGLFAFAMPRGSGKTTLCRAGVMWAILSGTCRFVTLIGADEDAAYKHLEEGVKVMLLNNQLLLEDFPHAVYPFRKMDGEARAAVGQRYHGERTRVRWEQQRLKFAWIPEPDSLSSGAVIETAGMTSNIRGPLYALPDGTQIRPQFVLADDVQTRESAASATQSNRRIETLCGDVAYLAGPALPIAVVAPVTVIYEGDMADQLLNREAHPEWQGERTKMVEQFPTNLSLWDRYAEMLRESQRLDSTPDAANDFYRKHWDAMNAGAVVSWPERHRPDELSGIQHAMNLKIRDEASFYAECQNEPTVQTSDMGLLTADEICAKLSGYERGEVPPNCSAITVFTDVQTEHLFWMICAWEPDFTGYVIDYGAWPDQKRNYFTRHDVRMGRAKLSLKYQGDEGGMTHAALTELGNKLCGGSYLTRANRRQLASTRAGGAVLCDEQPVPERDYGQLRPRREGDSDSVFGSAACEEVEDGTGVVLERRPRPGEVSSHRRQYLETSRA
jgi:hypothetical protein